jgi:hypothetical protein
VRGSQKRAIAKLGVGASPAGPPARPPTCAQLPQQHSKGVDIHFAVHGGAEPQRELCGWTVERRQVLPSIPSTRAPQSVLEQGERASDSRGSVQGRPKTCTAQLPG